MLFTLFAISFNALSVCVLFLPNKSLVKPITPPELIKMSGIKTIPLLCNSSAIDDPVIDYLHLQQ